MKSGGSSSMREDVLGSMAKIRQLEWQKVLQLVIDARTQPKCRLCLNSRGRLRVMGRRHNEELDEVMVFT